MNRRLLEHDPWSGISTYHSYDPATDITYIEEIQDVEPVMESNKAVQRMDGIRGSGVSSNPRLNEYERAGIKRGWWHVASVPNVIIAEWRKQGIDIWKWGKCEWTTRKIKQLLNSPDYRYLRTGQGRI